MQKLADKIHSGIGSKLFFQLTLVWFAISSAWIALSGLYPMAFDERYHLEVIKIYSHRVHPFWTSMTGDAPYGALSRDPSYLYHYLLSFPYRLLELITTNERTQVTILRFSSIVLFVLGLIVFRKVLRNAGCSKALSNLVIAFVAATPIVPLLAAQINYDNLFFLLLALALLQTQRILKSIKTNSLKAYSVIVLAIVCMTGSLVKYAFLPILISIIMILLYSLIVQSRKKGVWSEVKLLLGDLWRDFRKQDLKFKVILLTGFFVMFGLCLERYGVNIVRYHTPVPDCDQVLSVDQCFSYPPWRRNYITHWAKEHGKLDEIKDTNFVKFAFKAWPEKMTYHLFYTINGEKSEYRIMRPVSAIRNAALIALMAGAVLYFLNRKRIRKRYTLNPLLLVAFIYVTSLMLQNYSDFVNLGYPFGIQGRYLIPVLPILYAGVAIAFSTSLGRRSMIKTGVAVLALTVIITQGGGAGTFIIRSNDQWYWSDSNIVYLNAQARTILKSLIIND